VAILQALISHLSKSAGKALLQIDRPLRGEEPLLQHAQRLE